MFTKRQDTGEYYTSIDEIFLHAIIIADDWRVNASHEWVFPHQTGQWQSNHNVYYTHTTI